ncbi:protein SlyX [Vibrio cholerae 12129(1)]|nr:protein SlyX [Vibrio cholerae MJ-1236]EEO00988.1 protein SlyX [Vibrio cholerae 12129(1)]EEO01104.1 protein SlyX [Vibrio cholerae VL426]EEO11908.1 protein SlyX [Vibrio cholerae RC9]EEO15530.1 protein SlyX [Vibrio cholerae TMA 21]EEO19220.1 protein SlyX [Vibrio cholerae B33]EEO20876.1 protein SlyX [Vibrio cholerae BX 330286]KKP08385.1 lysis protein [Vibrio cholerae]
MANGELKMQEMSLTQLQERIEDLECKLAFQEQTIETLNDALTQQQLLLSKMQDQMKYVVGKVKNMDTSTLADPAHETPPPHY